MSVCVYIVAIMLYMVLKQTSTVRWAQIIYYYLLGGRKRENETGARRDIRVYVYNKKMRAKINKRSRCRGGVLTESGFSESRLCWMTKRAFSREIIEMPSPTETRRRRQVGRWAGRSVYTCVS